VQLLSPLLFAGHTPINSEPMPTRNSESDIDQDPERQGGKPNSESDTEQDPEKQGGKLNSESDIEQHPEKQGSKPSTETDLPAPDRTRQFYIVCDHSLPCTRMINITLITGSSRIHCSAYHHRHRRGCGHFASEGRPALGSRTPAAPKITAAARVFLTYCTRRQSCTEQLRIVHEVGRRAWE